MMLYLRLTGWQFARFARKVVRAIRDSHASQEIGSRVRAVRGSQMPRLTANGSVRGHPGLSDEGAGACQARRVYLSVICRPIPLPAKSYTNFQTIILYTFVLQTVLGMGMDTNVTAHLLR